MMYALLLNSYIFLYILYTYSGEYILYTIHCVILSGLFFSFTCQYYAVYSYFNKIFRNYNDENHLQGFYSQIQFIFVVLFSILI